MKHATRRFERIFWIVLYILSPALPIVVYFAGNWFSFFHAYSVSMTFGIIAYIYYLNQFIVAARPVYWDRLYGLDRMYRFHGTMAIVATIFAIGHALLKTVYFPMVTVQKGLGVLSFLVFAVVVLLSVIFMVQNRLAKLKPIRRLRTIAAKKWRWHYHRLKTVHNLVVLAAFIVLAHVLLAFSTLETFGRIVLMVLWFVVALGYYGWHKILRPAQARRKPFVVREVIRECDGVTTLRLDAPPERQFSHKAGQFVYLRFLDGVPGPEEHPFTISSPPSPEGITVTVKDLGDFSGDLGQVSAGAPVAIDGPYGVFTTRKVPEEQPLVCIAGGIGITPFFSILGDCAAAGSTRPMTLLWSVREPQEFFRLEELKGYADALPGLRIELFLTGTAPDALEAGRRRAEESGLPLHSGRATVERLRELALVDAEASYYLCGPSAMMETLIADLRKDGVPAPHFHFEAFAM